MARCYTILHNVHMQTWQKLKNDPTLFNRYFVKEYVIRAVRKFFEDRKYHELEAPILASSLPQERYLDVLETKLELRGEAKPRTAYLIPSTETWNKKILAAGLGEHFVITKVFRALEAIGPNHSPEFTMLEWYHLNATYFDLMSDCEELVNKINNYLNEKFEKPASNVIKYQGQEIDLTPPWPRFSIPELLEKYVDVKLEDIQTLEQIRKVAQDKGYKVYDEDDWQIIYEEIFLNEVEPHLPMNTPCFLYDFPRILCPLTAVNEKNPLVSQKVELYIVGKEIANGYTELRDWEEQKRRFDGEQIARAEMGRKPIAYDHQLVEALKSGLPDVAGIGMGIDRLAMIFADVENIADINYFPATELFS